MQDKLFDVLFSEDDLSWKTMIYDLVKKEQMDPWDIDISVLAKRFLEMLRQMKEMNFRISGKVLIAAAILLRLKSTKLVNEDLSALDNLIASSQQAEDEFYEELDGLHFEGDERGRPVPKNRQFTLIPKTPQPRKRKVSVYDLVEALQKALHVKERRSKRFLERQESLVEAPKEVMDISEEINNIHQQVIEYFKVHHEKGTLTFSYLTENKDRMEKIYTFVPLLHLTNLRKVDLEQEQHLGEIKIHLVREEDVSKEKHVK